MKTKLLLLLVLSYISFSAIANPVYLNCEFFIDKDASKFTVKLDEQSNKVTQTEEDGSAFNTEGFFSANSVTYQHRILPDIGGLKMTSQYVINREDLSLKYHFTTDYSDSEYSELMAPTVKTSEGSCKIAKQTKKAF